MQAPLKDIAAILPVRRFGRPARIEGLPVEITGASGTIRRGRQVRLTSGSGKQIPCEVVWFRDGHALTPQPGSLDRMTFGACADFENGPAEIFPARAWLGRVVDGFDEPSDGKATRRPVSPNCRPTVPVEEDDHNEPVADAAHGILDGHIVLERNIAERGRFPAIDLLDPVSRAMPGCNSEQEQSLVARAAALAVYSDVAELIRLVA